MEYLRVFAAANIGIQSVRKLTELQRELIKSKPSELAIGWVPPANIHLTLKFYGNVVLEQLAAVKDAVKKAAESARPFHLSAHGLGVFPDAENPRVLWVGIEHGIAPLTQLRERLEDASDALGFARDTRPFHGHLTLGRIKRGHEGVAAWLERYADEDCLTSTITDLTVYESRLQRSGAEYVSHCRAPFGQA